MSTNEVIQELKSSLEDLKQKISDLERSTDKDAEKKKMITWFNKLYSQICPLIDIVFQTSPITDVHFCDDNFKNKGLIKAKFDKFEIWFTINLFNNSTFSDKNIYLVEKSSNAVDLEASFGKYIWKDNYIYYPLIDHINSFGIPILIENNLTKFTLYFGLRRSGIVHMDYRLMHYRLFSLKSMFYKSIGDKAEDVYKFMPQLENVIMQKITDKIKINDDRLKEISYPE